MITQPSIPRLPECIRDELTEKIIPAIEDPTVLVSVEMMTQVLSALAVRAENDIEWMRQEADAIEAAAADLAPTFPDADRLAETLDDYRANRVSSMRLSEVCGEYDRAGEVLATLTEAAYTADDAAAIAVVEQLFEQRLSTEQAAIGTFIAVGRD